MDQETLLNLFHHLHHRAGGEHEVHHCGGPHRAINQKLNYEIEYCPCGWHRINKKTAVGHGTSQEEIIVEFTEACPAGGWHIESGRVKK